MIKIENTKVIGFEDAIKGARNSWNSWEKSDSPKHESGNYVMGEADLKLLNKLVRAGDSHAKALRMINVYCDITAPRMWWAEFDTYKHTTRCSCSTMHTLADKMFSLEDFAYTDAGVMQMTVDFLNDLRKKYLDDKSERNWRILKEQLPECYLQKSTVVMNYQTLRNMYNQRCTHRLEEWHDFCVWVMNLPYSKQLIYV